MLSTIQYALISVIFVTGMLITPSDETATENRLRIRESDDAYPTLIPNQTITMPLTADEPRMFEYNGRGGEVVSIYAYGMDAQNMIDTVIEVLDPDMNRIAYNNDTLIQDGDTEVVLTNARIENLVLPMDGQYLVRVDSFNGVSAGLVEVVLTQVNLFREQISREGNTTQIDLMLPHSMSYSHYIMAMEDDVLTITVIATSDSLDLILYLKDGQGNILLLNDDHGSEDQNLQATDARIEAFVVPATGEYHIQVSDFLGRSGDVRLIIEQQ